MVKTFANVTTSTTTTVAIIADKCVLKITNGLSRSIHQLILAGFHAHGIDMPFPPFQMRLESLNGKQTGRTLTSAGKGRQAGSL